LANKDLVAAHILLKANEEKEKAKQAAADAINNQALMAKQLKQQVNKGIHGGISDLVKQI